MFDAEAFGASEIFPKRPMGLQSPEEVVRSVFENGASHRMSELELSQVLSAVRSALTKGENPVQEESISSSCLSPPPDDRNDLQNFFWFLLSCNGTLQHVSKGCYALLGTSSGELTRRSVFSLVAVRDHHIVPPILHAGPSTSMSCRLHMRAQEGEPVFDVTFAKLSTRQVSSNVMQAEPMCEVLLSPAEAILSKLKIKNQEDTDWTLRLDNRKKKRSATLCVARAVAECHGSLSLLLDKTSRITNYVNMSGLRIDDGDLISRYVGDLCSKNDQLVLETLIESQSDCSAELQLIFREFDLTAHVQAQHSFGTVRLECQISRVRRTDTSTPQNSVENVVASDFNATLSPDPVVSTESISVISNGDPLSQLCTSVFSEEDPPIQSFNPVSVSSTPIFSPSTFSFSTQLSNTEQTKEENVKKQRKPRTKKIKSPVQPIKNAVLKSLLTSQRQSYDMSSGLEVTQDSLDPAMYQASTIPAQPMYMNNNMNQMSYQPASSQQCSSYMSGIQMCPSDFPMVPQNAPPMPSHGNGWPNDFYHQQQIQQYPQAVTAKPLKRKPSTTPERVSKMPYSQNPAFTFQQASPMMEGGVSSIAPTEEYPVQPMGSHLSPYRYSPSSSPYWPSSARPPSRSELIRMELRNSLQARQMAASNQHRLAVPHSAPMVETAAYHEVPAAPPSGYGLGADSLGFDLDIVLKDADGSLMDAELDTVYDFNLGGGCGFDMENDATRCLVMKLLS